MEAVPVSEEEFRNDYVEACQALPSHLPLQKINVFSYEGSLWLYAKPEYIFELGTHSLEFKPGSERWSLVD